jgi:hypothetical protein
MTQPSGKIVARPMVVRACGHEQEVQHYAVDKYRAQRLAKFQGTRCAECLIGGFLGGLVFSLPVEGDAGLWASVAVAFVGDCILISLLGAVVRRRRLGRFSNGRLDDHRWKAR